MFVIDKDSIDIDWDDNELLEKFADRFLNDSLRIITTRTHTPFDTELLYESVTVLIAMYMKKVKDGEINRDRVYH